MRWSSARWTAPGSGPCRRPQVFRRDVLERALAAGPDVVATATDDASLVERLGGEVRLVMAPRENLKVTTAEDLRLAELLLRDRAAR